MTLFFYNHVGTYVGLSPTMQVINTDSSGAFDRAFLITGSAENSRYNHHHLLVNLIFGATRRVG